MSPNEWRAYAMVDHCVVTNPITGEDKRVEFAEPKHKLIASGTREHCAMKALNYASRHGVDTGVIEHAKPGNPWESEWAGIERMAR